MLAMTQSRSSRSHWSTRPTPASRDTRLDEEKKPAAASTQRPKTACACGGGCSRCAAGRSPSDAHEREADQIADGSRRTTAADLTAVAGPPAAAPIPPTTGRPLPEGTRRALEAHMQTDLRGVRLHVDAAAAHMNRKLQARAFTHGQDIYMPPAEFRPGVPAGDRLLAHEVAHTVQQSKGVPAIQRQPAPAQPDFTAQGMLGLPTGSHVVITRSSELIDFLFDQIASNAPEVAGSLKAIFGTEATIAAATDDRVDIHLDKPASLPAADKTPARTIRDLTISLRRTASGHFDFSITGREGDPGQVATLYEELDLTPSQDGAAVVLSAGSEPHLRLTPASSATGTANFEAFTAPYLVGQSAAVRRFAPRTIGLVTVTGLPAAAVGSPAEKAIVRRIIERSAAQRAEPRQTLTFGAGIAGGPDGSGVHPLLRASWRYGFQPWSVGGLAQVPLQLDLFYAPSSSVFAAVSTGVGTSLSSLRIPINLRLTGGLGAGEIADVPQPDGRKSSQAAFGPTIGAAAGYERGWFRMELRYDQLLNLLPGPHIPTGSLNVGGAF